MDDEIIIIITPPRSPEGLIEAHSFPQTCAGYSAAIELLRKHRANLVPSCDED